MSMRATWRVPTLGILASVLAPAGAGAQDASPTFAVDVAPIFYEKCVTCHRELVMRGCRI